MFDLIIVGAGPAGLSLARTLSDTPLKISMIEALPETVLNEPPFDGREIALTHPSKRFLEKLGIWDKIPTDEIFKLENATVINADNPFQLNFNAPKTNSKGENIDRLGYLVSNHLLRQASFQAVENQANLTWFKEKKVVACSANSDYAEVVLHTGEIVRGALLVAGDSRFSSVRKMRGIPADTHEFGRTVIVFRLKHELPHQHTATECFFYGSTLALLPLSEHLTNCVITIDAQYAPDILKLSPEALAQFVAEKLNYRFGQMELVSTVHDYPLVGVHARKFYAQRTALIGDSACGMHPVTAQGYNLGLQSTEILSQLIIRQYGQGLDIGDVEILQEYNRRHQLNTRVLYHGTNTIVKLFTREELPFKFMRKTVLRVAEALPPLKSLITRTLTG